MTRGFAFWVVCRLLGLVILLAGIAKAYELLAYQRISTLYAVAGSLEMVFGLWVVCSNRSRLTWWLLVGCFTTFMGVSFYQAISGQTSCGCFGTLHIAPWFTFSFDLGASVYYGAIVRSSRLLHVHTKLQDSVESVEVCCPYLPSEVSFSRCMCFVIVQQPSVRMGRSMDRAVP